MEDDFKDNDFEEEDWFANFFFFGNEKCLDIFGIIWIIKTKENFVLKI
jgi:hypothetical protein